MTDSTQPDVKVWDPFVRLFHWSLVAAFLVAYFVEAEDSTLAVHVWAGYAVGGLVVLRIIWGFVGTKHARFSDFLFRPFAAVRYLFDLFGGRARRYLGHSPAGAWMVFALLLGLSATVLSGMALYGQEESKGPFAAFFAGANEAITFANPAYADDDGEEAEGQVQREGGDGGQFKDVHEVAANLALVLALLHIGGVVLASVAHRENLARSMVTGRKRPE
ncbi:MAG: cytochrome b/b6 domain-containing protein [Paracoccaceae bacterium]